MICSLFYQLCVIPSTIQHGILFYCDMELCVHDEYIFKIAAYD